jgi:hypothetical protein
MSAEKWIFSILFFIFIVALILFIREFVNNAPYMWFLYYIPIMLLVAWAVYQI